MAKFFILDGVKSLPVSELLIKPDATYQATLWLCNSRLSRRLYN